MNILKTLTLSVVILFSLGAYAQDSKIKGQLPDGGRMVNLQDPEYAETTFQNILDLYKGKVVYLDFWASWCRPCKNEMPHSSKVKEQFKGKDVVFVYISSDRDPKAWKNGVSQLNIKGENYLTSGNVWKDYNALFNVKTIPRYVLIDKEGKVVSANAKRPSNPEIVTDINKLL
ncbi:MAG: TlpA family protein disulfide reductase [Bacteroidetes bacterium]|nr:TlpA family protein disulfide reductase [Bacteroidota bacterium]